MQIEAATKTTEGLIQDYEAVQAKLHEMNKDLQRQKRGKMCWRFFSIVILCIYLFQKKSSTIWLPVADSQQMCVVMSDWWGLKVQAYYPVWRKPTAESGEYSEQWCIKYPDFTWRVFYGGHGNSPSYMCPPAVNNTYF